MLILLESEVLNLLNRCYYVDGLLLLLVLVDKRPELRFETDGSSLVDLSFEKWDMQETKGRELR